MQKLRGYLPLLFLPLPFLFYFFTMCPAIGLGDTALLIDGMAKLKVNSHVNNHNLTVIAGHFLQLVLPGEMAFRANLVSVFFGGLAVVSFYIMGIRMTGRPLLAAAVSLALMVSRSLWWHSTIAEVYALNACFTVWIAHCLFLFSETRRLRFLYIASALSGLALFNHVQMGIWIPAIFIFIILNFKNDKKALLRVLAASSLCYLAGFLPYVIVFIRDAAAGESIRKVLYWALGGDFQGIMFGEGFFRGLYDFLYLTFLQYPSPYLLLVIAGPVLAFRDRRYRDLIIALAAGFCVNTYFFMRYPTWDKFAFLLPSFVMLGIAGLAGADVALRKWLAGSRWGRAAVIAVIAAGALIPPFLYAAIPRWARNPGSAWHARYNNDYTENTHDCAAYIVNPDKRNYRDISELADLIFEKLPAGSLLVDDDSRTYYPLAEYYQRYYDRRPDVTIVLINSWGFRGWGESRERLASVIRRSIGSRPVFLISTKHPYVDLVNELFCDGIVTEKFDLGGRRWIYRLRREPSAVERGARLEIDGIITGRNIESGKNQEVKGIFRPGEIVTAMVSFKKNSVPVRIEFLWKDGSGRIVHRSRPIIVPPENTMAWARLDGKGRSPGRWSVEVLANGRFLKSTYFIIR
ncbi:MAG: DUF2723 domain-containing protein [Spirochaetes bacterium]|nr:DUF2723 domain-containing protein [Spirochaetota bacterium]